MRRSFILPTLFAVLCFAPASAVAQNGAASPAPAVAVLPPVSNGCPVKFSVQRKPAGAIVWTNGKHQQPIPGQGVQLDFDNHDATRIVSATVVVHGTSGAVRVIPAAAAPGDNLTQTFEVRSNYGASPLRSRELWTKSMATVSWIEITRIQFIDGSTWHESNDEACKAPPNGFLPVAANWHLPPASAVASGKDHCLVGIREDTVLQMPLHRAR